MKKLDRILFIILSAAIVVSIGFIIYFNVVPQKINKYTEFYVLNAEGQAADYPRQVAVGSTVDVILGMVNHEHQRATYVVEIQMAGAEVGRVDVGKLDFQQKWQQKVSFTPQTVGDNQRVDFILYKDGGANPYIEDPLQLYLNVIPK
jgi:uncharacterized membrane protein